jgi:hypothetical protein
LNKNGRSNNEKEKKKSNRENEQTKTLESGVHYADQPATKKSKAGKMSKKETQQLIRNFEDLVLSKQHRSSNVGYSRSPFKRHSTGFLQPASVQAVIDKEKLDAQANITAAANSTNSTDGSAVENLSSVPAGNDDIATGRDLPQNQGALPADAKSEDVLKKDQKEPDGAANEKGSRKEGSDGENQKTFSVKKIKLSSP